MEMFLGTSLFSKNIIFHDFITMVEQKNMALEFQLLLTVQLARETQDTETTETELSSFCDPGFQVAGSNNFSTVIYMIKDTDMCELYSMPAPIGDAEFQGTGTIDVLSHSNMLMQIKHEWKNTYIWVILISSNL